MEKPTNEQEQARYNQLIRETERSLEDVKREHRKVSENFQQLSGDIHNGFQQLAMVVEEEIYKGSQLSLRLQRKNEEQEQVFRQKIQESEEVFTEKYAEEIKGKDDEIEKLYEKRSEIQWD